MPSPIVASLSLPDLQALAADGGYAGIAALSNTSAVLLLSACRAFLHSDYYWTGAGYTLTEAERDEIDEMVSEAEWEIMSSAIGMIMPIATADVPVYALLCDGSSYLRVDYPSLYEVLDPAFITDADNFFVPDLQSTFVQGAGGADNVGDTGGTDTKTLSVSEMPAHTHTTNPHAHSYLLRADGVLPAGGLAPIPAVIPVPAPAVTGSASPTTNSTGDGDAYDPRPPYLALRYIIIAGTS